MGTSGLHLLSSTVSFLLPLSVCWVWGPENSVCYVQLSGYPLQVYGPYKHGMVSGPPVLHCPQMKMTREDNLANSEDWIFRLCPVSLRSIRVSLKVFGKLSFGLYTRNRGGWGRKVTLGKSPCFSFFSLWIQQTWGLGATSDSCETLVYGILALVGCSIWDLALGIRKRKLWNSNLEVDSTYHCVFFCLFVCFNFCFLY